MMEAQISLRSYSEVELVDVMGTDDSVVHAARVSTNTHDKEVETREARGLINYLVRNKHYSPLEHTSMTVRVHTPIFVSRQVVRHRTLSFNEISGRYSELEPIFYVPNLKRPLVQQGKVGEYVFTPGTEQQNTLTLETVAEASALAWGFYQRMLEGGVAREVARSVLPVNIYTTLYMTGNLRTWLQFLDLRIPSDISKPQHEIAEVAEKIEQIVKEHFPLVFDAWASK